jgi:hypothetical protein
MINTIGTWVQPCPTAPSQARDITALFGVIACADKGVVYVAVEDWIHLCEAVWGSKNYQAVVGGYYLGGNGNMVTVPGWTMNVKKVARLRDQVKRQQKRALIVRAFRELLTEIFADHRDSRGVTR